MENKELLIAINKLRDEVKHELGGISKLLVRIADTLDGLSRITRGQ